MPSYSCVRTFLLAFAAGCLPLLLALSSLGQSAKPSPAAVETPQQVADTLDSIVQPRFQQNAGQFGVDRIVFAGHDNIYSLAGMNASERRRFRRVNAAHRPYIIAFLHCAHKPGRDLLTKTRDTPDLTRPSLQTLSSATATSDGTQKLFDWSDTHLEKAVLPSLPVLRHGTGIDRDFGNWRLVMRPVQASRDSCLGCHAGAKRGDTLGVMVYAVDKAAIHAPIQSLDDGGDFR
jgi:hypothetical protein